MLLLQLISEILNCSMIIFWTSHLDLSRSLRSKKVKGGQRILGPKNNFGRVIGLLFLRLSQVSGTGVCQKCDFEQNSSRTLECEPEEKYYWQTFREKQEMFFSDAISFKWKLTDVFLESWQKNLLHHRRAIINQW